MGLRLLQSWVQLSCFTFHLQTQALVYPDVGFRLTFPRFDTVLSDNLDGEVEGSKLSQCTQKASAGPTGQSQPFALMELSHREPQVMM